MISVLLSAYNGEEYIEEQLLSLLEQSKNADEVCIIDDNSTDGTAELVSQFIEKNNLKKTWCLKCNTVNRGWKSNFREGLLFLNGDIVMFCDQDDIWMQNKIEETTKILNQNSDINVVGTSVIHFFCDGHKKLEGNFDKIVEMVSYNKNGDGFMAHPAGCTMAVRRTYIEEIMPYYEKEWSHDEFFWRYATIDGTCALVHDSYILHRISGKNVTSLPARSLEKRKEATKNNIKNYDGLYKYTYSKKHVKDYEKKVKCVKYFLEGNRVRYEFLNRPNMKSFLLSIKYRKIYVSMRQMAGDIVFGLLKRRGV